jgi:hypothetical protein
MMASALAATAQAMAAPMRRKARAQCPECKEQYEPGKGSCYCGEMHRRGRYDAERQRRGLVALYRPPSMR